MRPVVAQIEQVAPTTMTVLVQGETGTGKELVARALHQESSRSKRPFIPIDCGAIPENLVESELFGHEKGAFSGADTRKDGHFALADGGTLFFDEVSNLPLPAQAKLLRAIQERRIQPLGSKTARDVDVRFVAATNERLQESIAAARFREDLYYRLATVTLHLPALRDRREDVPALAESWLRRADPASPATLSVALRRRLLSTDLSWPGNVRQLERLMQRARSRARARDPRATVVDLEHVDPRELGAEAPGAGSSSPSRTPLGRYRGLVAERELLEATERSVLSALIAEHGGVISKAARALELPRSTLVSRLEALGLETRKNRGG